MQERYSIACRIILNNQDRSNKQVNTMKKILSICVACLIFTVAQAQEQEKRETPQERQSAPKGFDRSKLFLSGTFGFTFGSSVTMINVSPQLGYRFSDILAAGAGVNFIYNSVDYGSFKQNLGYAGVNAFGRIYPIPYIVLHAQPELNYRWGKRRFNGSAPDEKLNGSFVPSLLIGGGANIPSGNGSITIMVLYDAVQDARSPYDTKPFLSFGYNIGL